MSGHFGIPGPGGSMGKCAVCGEDFGKEVLMDFVGIENERGIQSFSVGFIKQTLYAHDPDCVTAVKDAFANTEDPEAVRDRLPDGPLKTCLGEAIVSQTEGT